MSRKENTIPFRAYFTLLYNISTKNTRKNEGESIFLSVFHKTYFFLFRHRKNCLTKAQKIQYNSCVYLYRVTRAYTHVIRKEGVLWQKVKDGYFGSFTERYYRCGRSLSAHYLSHRFGRFSVLHRAVRLRRRLSRRNFPKSRCSYGFGWQ